MRLSLGINRYRTRRVYGLCRYYMKGAPQVYKINLPEMRKRVLQVRRSVTWRQFHHRLHQQSQLLQGKLLWLHLQPNEKYMLKVTLTRLCILNFIMVNSADTNNKSQIAISRKRPRCNSQLTARSNEHTVKLSSSVDPHEMTHHATFLLGLHRLPNYIFKCEKLCEARSINP